MAQYELNLRDYWRIIKKKKIIVIVTVVMLGSFSFFFSMMNKPDPIYQAFTSLKIDISTDLTGMYMEGIRRYAGDEMTSRGEEIKSVPMVEKAAQVMGLLDSSLTKDEIRHNKEYFFIVEKLIARIKTEQEGHTNIIHIKVTDYEPQRTSDLANALAKVYIEESFQNKNAKAIKTLNAIENQLRGSGNNYKNAERKVRAYKEKNKLLLLEGTVTRLSAEITGAEKSLEEIRSDINSIDNILFEIDQNPDYILFISFDILLNHQNSVLKALQTQLDQLSADERQHLQHYTEHHPTIIDIRRQIETKQRRFNQEIKAFRETLVQTENNIYDKWKKLSRDYRSIPLLDFNLANIERELEINRQLYYQIEGQHQGALIRRSELVNEVSLLKPAFLPTKPINPTMIGPTTAIGTVIGIILGVVLAFVAETLDTTFSTIDDIEKTLETTVVGIVPFVDIEEIKKQLMEKVDTPISDEILEMQARLVAHYNPKSTMAEAFRALRTNIHFGMIDKGYKSIMVTSSVSGEGKTTVAVNLAVSMAQIGLNTLLVEADLRKPRISKLFGIEREPGLTDVILRRDNLDNVIRTMSDLMMGTMALDTFRTDNIPGIEYLNILTAGKHEQNPSEIIASKIMGSIISDLKEKYDLIIFDSAPVIQATDSTVLGAKVDTVVLVYYQGKISRGTLRRAKNQLEMLKSDVLGVAINGMKADISADYADYRYSYEYQYSYGDAKTQKPKNKILEPLNKFFINQQEGLHSTFFDKIRKLRIIGAIAALTVFIGGGCIITNNIKTCSRTSAPAVVTETQSPIDSTFDMVPEAIVSESMESVEAPSELKQLQQEFGIQKQAVPQQNIELITTPGIEEKIPVKILKPPVKQQTTPVQRQPERQHIEPISERPVFRSRPTPVEEATSVKQLYPATPYTIKMGGFQSLQSAKYSVNTYKENGLNLIYITVDFSGQSTRSYIVCYGAFTNEKESNQKAMELQFLGFDGEFQTANLPYAILLGDHSTKDQVKADQNRFPDIKDFIYPKSSGSLTASLVGAFSTEEIANLFLHQHPDLSDKVIILR
ncbi:MAG: polysaccharide biosynthesis tyrosine autokinase [Candidatus Marinimicrobia bacterium]|nr:polysaccharide biosynthesis tyrosine autokinase [Candidatus Neomarinimicrobiota bacterium]